MSPPGRPAAGWWEGRALPWLMDKAMASGDDIAEIRADACAPLSGEVLELGFGSGLNVPHYPPAVTRVHAVDPAAYGWELAAARVAASPVPIEHVGLDGQDLPLPDASVDHAVTTWTLCSIPDLPRALGEVRRVLRPGGTLRFAEHGLAPDEPTRRWQRRITPVWRRAVGGCHLDRPIDACLVEAGFDVAAERRVIRGPRPWVTMYVGVASVA